MENLNAETAIRLASLAQKWADIGVPMCSTFDDGRECNHWNGTVDEIDEFLACYLEERLAEMGLKNEVKPLLSEDAITILSMSRDYGPTPSLTNEERLLWEREMWPLGNGLGVRYDWDVLAVRIAELQPNQG